MLWYVHFSFYWTVDVCTQQDTDWTQASHQKWQRIAIWSMLGVVGLFYGAYFFIAIFACRMYCPFKLLSLAHAVHCFFSFHLHTARFDNVSNVKQSL